MGRRKPVAGSSRPSTALATFAVAALLAGVNGCTKDSVVASAGLPGTTIDADIRDVTVRFEYIDAFVSAGGFQYRFFFPDSEPCRVILYNPKGARFVWIGPLGRLTQGELRCSPVGVLSLQAWRNRGPRRSREPLPRSQANFKEVWRDDEMVLVRGRFPLAGTVGWAGGLDSIAVLPDIEDCLGFLERGVASMEFRASGNRPLVLIARNRLCPITGFAQPPPGR